MVKSNFWKIVPLLLIVYVAVGDSFLPPSLGNYSRITRDKINSYLLNIFPERDIESPYGKNDDIIDQVEQKNR
ncbi:hypothetical protein [Gloeocapsa sp. PCC 73106]|uniref:hypothetical protein n=1 Tax=Gloeocapsa sp. PCC 73106 TaxID=102232 RepID=UPI0002AC7CF9|nr:hypothetical protein [Gloeocapsa sp. PCC 73106]ELR98698.1 hypothetical protein GLO73106DRAFT_00025360 [Gloeocapsa sp. PCC 73106]